MKVTDLIEVLKSCDPNDDIMISVSLQSADVEEIECQPGFVWLTDGL